MNLEEREAHYSKKFPTYPELYTDKGWLLGYWVIGNYYRNKTDYYGAYPHSYISRIFAVFPDIDPKKILHLFSGSLSTEDVNGGIRFDINPEYSPDIIGDAEQLSEYRKEIGDVDMIMGDPPYSGEDAEHYGTPMVNRNKVVKECTKILKPGGYLVWLDQAYPMFRKKDLKLFTTIGLMRSTNHRFRTVLIWKRL